jgi:hypothetical protein
VTRRSDRCASPPDRSDLRMVRRDRRGACSSAWPRESGTVLGIPAPLRGGATPASPACPETTPELEASVSTHVDYLGSLFIFEPGRLRCSLSSSIPAPGKPVPSASTVASPSTTSPTRWRPDAARDCRRHRDVQRAESRGEKTEMPASSRRYGAVTCELRGQSRSVRRTRTNASTRRSAPAVCAPFASPSSRVSTGRYSVASVWIRETVADRLHPHSQYTRCHSEPRGEESRVR